MDDLDAREPKLDLPVLDHAVKIRRGPFPRGSGRAVLRDARVVVSRGETELLNAPVIGTQITVRPFFGDIGVRLPRRLVRRNWLRLTVLDTQGRRDRPAGEAWGTAASAVERWERHARYWLRARRAVDAASSGGLRDRAWRRTGPLGKQLGVLQAGHGRLSFLADGQAVWSAAFDQVGSVRGRSNRVVVKTPEGRQVFGFDPRRTPDGDWEKGDSGADGPVPAERSGGVATDTTTSNPGLDAQDAGNALALLAYLLFVVFEGWFIRWGRRREWMPVLQGERPAQAALDARAAEAVALWEREAAY